MALQHLTDEQIRTWSSEQKDQWWLKNVFRGDMPQLTLRSAVTGFVLGGFLSATNLYVGAKTGWTLGVGLTSVILAFAMFRVMAKMGMARDFTILENNAMQSIATSAGYMTAPLTSSLVAYMMVTNETIPWQQIILWNVVLSVMGVLVAFPMKRRFINNEQQPFPEGRACGVVLDTLYTGAESTGMLKAKSLAVAAAIAGTIQFCAGEAYQQFLQVRLLGMEQYYHLVEKLDGWVYVLFEKLGWGVPNIGGVDLRQLALSPALDLSMIGAGGLMGMRVTNSLMIGALVNFAIVAPWMIAAGEILPKNHAEIALADGSYDAAAAIFGRPWLLNNWCLWWGIAMMVTASMTSLFAKPQIILSAFRGLGRKKGKASASDPLAHIELPLSVSLVGMPILVALTVWMGSAWFGVNPWHGLLAIPLICVLTLIAANATALTSTTPTGSLSKITQFTFGALDKTNPGTNLMTAGMTAEVASNASNLLMDIKPGYMLGAKPRQQAIGHCIGIISGAIASTPLFFLLFLSKRQAGVPAQEPLASSGSPVAVDEPHTGSLATDGLQIPPDVPGLDPIVPTDLPMPTEVPLADLLVSDEFPMPGAVQWKGVADLISRGASNLAASAQWSMAIAAFVALVLEIVRIRAKGRFPFSPLAIGLGVVIPPDSTFMMWCGSLLFWFMARRFKTPGTRGNTIWVESQEPICAGLIAGAALVGIGNKLVEVLVLG